LVNILRKPGMDRPLIEAMMICPPRSGGAGMPYSDRR
jgi:hypothetical protein